MSGSQASKVALLVGTRRGLFRVVGRPGPADSANQPRWSIDGPHIAGHEVYHAVLDPRDGRTGWAAARHNVWGTHLYRSSDAGQTWEALPDRPAFPPTLRREVKAIWHVAPEPADQPERLYAGVEPAGLFVSEDSGASWRWLEGLEDHPTRKVWQPAKGGMALHSVQVDPRDPDRIYVAVSAGGCYRTDDGGPNWKAINRGTRAEFLPEALPEAGQCVHSLRLHPAQPDRLVQQSHCGTYVSDDRGESWRDVSLGLPSDFGYVVGLDRHDPDRWWVIPEESSHLRSVCDQRLRVYETADAGNTWTARVEGLPQEHVYASVLREALTTDEADPCGVYFGTATGHLYASPDGSAWELVASHLPKILSVRASVSGG